MPGIGPMVYRSAHVGAAVLLLGALQFLGGMVLAQWLYPDPPGYSLTGNDVSDLGAGGGTHALVFNLSIVLFGLALLGGGYLFRAAFPRKTRARAGIAALGISGLGAIGVGLVPESGAVAGLPWHGIFALVTFLFGGLALLALSLAMLRDTRWGGYRFYTFLSGLVVLGALGLYARGADLGLGPGGIERVIVGAGLLWLIVAGAHVLRIPRFRPDAGGPPPAPSD